VVVIVRTVTFVFLGTDFQDSPFATLEKLEAIAPEVREHFSRDSSHVSGSVVVATCNRFEVYLDTDHPAQALASVVAVVSEVLGEAEEHTAKIFRVLQGEGAVGHLFHVAAGLESMVVGEGEIMAQLRAAMAWAKDLRTLTPALQNLTEGAFRASKKVAQIEGFAHSGRSVIDSALELAEERLGALEGCPTLVIGTGAYARVVLAALKRRGIEDVAVFSRSGRAQEFGARHGVRVVQAEDLRDAVAGSSLVVSASGAPGYVVSVELLNGVMWSPEKTVFIDVALSRDVDPRLEDVGGASVITLESIRRVIPRDHTTTIAAAEKLVAEEIKNFLSDSHGRTLAPVVATLRAHVEQLIVAEVEAVRGRHGDGAADGVKRSLHRVTNQLLHTPLVRGRDLARDGHSMAFREAVDLVFGLEAPSDD